MKLARWIPALSLCALASAASAQGVGSKLPPLELEGYSQTPAKGFEDFTGRAVLIEFFAFW